MKLTICDDFVYLAFEEKASKLYFLQLISCIEGYGLTSDIQINYSVRGDNPSCAIHVFNKNTLEYEHLTANFVIDLLNHFCETSLDLHISFSGASVSATQMMSSVMLSTLSNRINDTTLRQFECTFTLPYRVVNEIANDNLGADAVLPPPRTHYNMNEGSQTLPWVPSGYPFYSGIQAVLAARQTSAILPYYSLAASSASISDDTNASFLAITEDSHVAQANGKRML